MSIDKKHIGKKYGPFRYTAALEKMREFANTTAGGSPTRIFALAPEKPPHALLVNESAGKESKYGSVIAHPTFSVNFAMEPFAAASTDPDLKIDLLRLVHGEQQFEYFDVIRPGDVLETSGEITSIMEKGPLDFMVMETTTKNQTGKMVLKGTWTAIIRR
jgi:acyl dehydratase